MSKNGEKLYRALLHRAARNVVRLRKEQGLTLQAVGERAGLHWRHLQKIESAEVNMTFRTMARLAAGLGVDPTTLIAKPSSR